MFKSLRQSIIICLCTTAVIAQDHKKVNCKGEFDYSKTQIAVSATYLTTTSASVGLTPQTAPTDKWTVAILSQQRSLCESYKASSEQQFPTSVYLEQMAQLRAWELDFMKISLAAQQVQTAQVTAAKGGKGPTVTTHQQEQALAKKIQSFLNTPPHVSAPATAVKVTAYPDEPMH